MRRLTLAQAEARSRRFRVEAILGEPPARARPLFAPVHRRVIACLVTDIDLARPSDLQASGLSPTISIQCDNPTPPCAQWRTSA